MKNFIAKYVDKGITKVIRFDGNAFDKAKAEKLLEANKISNFFFLFEPAEFIDMPDGSVMVSGEVGFDITFDRLKPYIDEGRKIVLNSEGGDLWEALKIYDYIRAFAPELPIGVFGINMSASTVILAASKHRSASPNSRHLIHNPWAFAVGDAETMLIQSQELQVEEDNLVSIYVGLLGKTADEVKALMKPERIMTTQDAYNIGLINEITGGETSPTDPPLVENNTNLNEVNMDAKKAKEELGILAKAIARIENLFAAPKNLVLQDVNGVEIDFGADITSEDMIVEGITGITIDGKPAEGDRQLPGGKMLTFTAGTLTKIVDPAAANEALIAENTALKQEIVDFKANISALEAKNKEGMKALSELTTKFNSFRAEFSKGEPQSNATPPAVPAESNKRQAFKS